MQPNPSLFGGVFVINLDRRPDRLEEFTEEMKMLDMPFERFSAIYTDFGIDGCGLSHLSVLKLAKERGYKNVLIFEDDFKCLVSKEVFWKAINTFSQSTPFDVYMLSYLMDLSGNFTEDTVKVFSAQTTSGYIVNESMYDSLINLYEDAMPKLVQTREHWIYANDQIWKQLQPESRWYASKIRLGKQRDGYSNLTGNGTTMWKAVNY
jgi:GR25 family glycosyltransferase involved in LPS biosynthesis